MMVMYKRSLAYILDIYIVSLSQLILFSLYHYYHSGEFRLSMVYIIENFKILFISIGLVYFSFSEFFFSKTLGKKIFGLEVLFEKKSLKFILVRTLTRLFPLDLFFIIIFKNRVLHDYLSKSYVQKNYR